MIAVKCTGCGKVYQVAETLAGRAVECPCGARPLVPGTSEQPGARPPDQTRSEWIAYPRVSVDRTNSGSPDKAVKRRVAWPARFNFYLALLGVVSGLIMVWMAATAINHTHRGVVSSNVFGFVGAVIVLWYAFIAYGAYELGRLGN